MALSSYIRHALPSHELGTARTISIPGRKGEVYDLRVERESHGRIEILEGYRPKQFRATGTTQTVQLRY